MDTQTSSKGSKQLHQITETSRGSAEQMATDFGTKAKNIASDTAHAAGQYYGQASTWVEQNYGKTLGMVGLVAASGILGYFLGRNRTNAQSEMQSPMHHS